MRHKRYKLSLETRLKMSAAHKGKPQSRELVEKRAALLRGKPLTKATKKKLRDAALFRLGKDPSTHKSQKEIRDAWKAIRLKNPAEWKRLRSVRISAGRKKRWEDPESRARTVAGLRMAWNSGHDERVKAFRTPEFRANISKALKGCVPSHRCGIKPVAYEKDGLGIWMRSRSEVEFAKRLDALGVEWIYEAFVFQVGKKRTWMPDFYLPKLEQFVEIKGYLRTQNKRKIYRAIRHYSGTKFTILTVSKYQDIQHLELKTIEGVSHATV